MAYDPSSKLEPFLLLSKSARGAACVQLVKDVLSAPDVYVFAELLDLPNIKDLAEDPSTRSWFTLLQIFSHGTYKDYIATTGLPLLTETQYKKLKHLSIVTMSETSRTLPYADLMTSLDIPNVRALEDLVIEAIYSNVIRAKLDQKKEQLQVEYSMGRDLRPGQIDEMQGVLVAWKQTSSRLLQSIEERIRDIQAITSEQKQRKAQHDAEIDKIKIELQTNKENQQADFADKMEGIERGPNILKRDSVRARAKRSRRE